MAGMGGGGGGMGLSGSMYTEVSGYGISSSSGVGGGTGGMSSVGEFSVPAPTPTAESRVSTKVNDWEWGRGGNVNFWRGKRNEFGR